MIYKEGKKGSVIEGLQCLDLYGSMSLLNNIKWKIFPKLHHKCLHKSQNDYCVFTILIIIPCYVIIQSPLDSISWALRVVSYVYTYTVTLFTPPCIRKNNRRHPLERKKSWSLIKGKNKVVSVHAAEAYRGNGGIAPVTLNLGTKWRRAVKFTARLLYWQDTSQPPFNRRLGGHRSRSKRCLKRYLAPTGIRTPERLALSLSLQPGHSTLCWKQSEWRFRNHILKIAIHYYSQCIRNQLALFLKFQLQLSR